MERFSDMLGDFMSKNMKNYLDLTLIETYNVLISDTDPWPTTYNSNKKIKLIDQMIEYFTVQEEYERCAKLVLIKEMVLKELKANKKDKGK